MQNVHKYTVGSAKTAKCLNSNLRRHFSSVRIFGPKRGGVTGWWRKLHNEELHNLYSSPSKIRIKKSRRMRWARHVARMGEKRNVYRLLVGKPEGKRPLGRPRRRWIENIKMDLLEIGLSVVDWIGLAQDRYRWRALVNSVMDLRVSLNAVNYRMAAQLVACRVVLSSTKLVS
jgi:hypothetical protein